MQRAQFVSHFITAAVITRYDAFDRVVHTYWSSSGFTTENQRANFENSIGNTFSESPRTSPTSANGLELYYTTNVLPAPVQVFLTTHVYDKYPNWIGTIPEKVLDQIVRYNYTNKPKGLETAVYLKALDVSGNTATSRSYTLFDSKLRPVRSHTENYLGGYSRSDVKYDFIGNVLKTETYHKRTAADDELKTEESFTYTDEDRLLEHTHKINALPAETLSHNEYDALGQLVVKKVGNIPKSPLQHIDYKYNIRGWLTDINSVNNLAPSGQPQDLFAFKINYHTLNDAHADVDPLYNGNIAQTFWRTANDNIKRSYGYVYDPLNRLTDALYKIPGSSVNDSYNEQLSYDKNGNILTLKRNGEDETEFYTFMIDDLDYDYDGNQLRNVTDTSGALQGFNDGNKHTQTNNDDFEYDDYGNMIVDRNKGITNITYNHLNLPKKITFENNRSIEYLYAADGSKLKKTVTDGATNKTVDYLNGFQYRNALLDFFPTVEGYVRSIPLGIGGNPHFSFHYIYNYTDHLGNIRLKYTKHPQTGNIQILEENSYYPFGLKHEGYNPTHEIIEVGEPMGEVTIIPVTEDLGDPYKYKYQGQERQDDFGLNWDSFKWRNYDYAIGRFFNIDPLAEDYPYNSTYAFQENKMGLGRELEGLEMISERNQNGKSITLNYNVKPINNTQYPDGTILLNNNDFNNLIQARAEQTESTFSGPTANGETVTANVVFDNNATIMWEYNLMIDIEGTATGMEAFGQMSPGKTTEVGNTQENRTQVNVYSHFGKDGELIITPLGTNEATHTGTHEDAHVGGVEHNNISNNIGNPNGTGTEMTPSQRSDLINLVEQQQKN